MKKLKELLRLKHQAMLTNRQIGKALNISASTVSYYLRGTQSAGIKMLVIEPFCKQLIVSRKLREEHEWEQIYKEMQSKHMTLQLVYEEYLSGGPVSPYSYSHFSRKYKQWRKQQSI